MPCEASTYTSLEFKKQGKVFPQIEGPDCFMEVKKSFSHTHSTTATTAVLLDRKRVESRKAKETRQLVHRK